MANIDELHFAVILDYSDFKEQVNACKGLAKELNSELSDALNFRKRMQTAPLKSYEKELNKAAKAAKDASKNTKDFGKSVSSANSYMEASKKALRTLSQLTGMAFSVVGIRRFLSSLIDITGQFEVQKMALRNMLQDIDKADKIFDDLYQFSSKSTYRFSELAKYAKQLAAFNIDKDSLLDTTKMLGDVASGVGVSMDRIILAYGHVKSSGFLRGIQLRSFSQNGVPVLEELSKMLTEIEGKTVSLGDVFDKMMKREITFEMVEEAFKRMTSEGGKFYQMQEVLAKTLAGQINILKGKWENLMYAMGESQEGILKGVVSSLTNIVSSTENFGKAIVQILGIFGAYRAGVMLNIAATEGWAAATNIGLIGALKGLARFLVTNPYIVLATTIGFVVTQIIKFKNEVSDSEKILNSLKNVTDQYNSTVNTELRELDILVGRMKAAKEGTDEYRLAKLALEKRFDPYIQQLRNEGVAVNDLAALYDGLAQKITNANKQRFLEKAQASISEAYSNATENIEKDTQHLINTMADELGRSLTGDEEGAIRHFISTAEQNDVFKSLNWAFNKKRQQVVRSVSPTGGSYSSIQELPTFMQTLWSLRNRDQEAANTLGYSMLEAAKRFDAAITTIEGAGNGGDKLVTLEQVLDNIKKDMADISALEKKAATTGLVINEEEGIDEEAKLKQLRDDLEEDLKQYKLLTGTDYNKQMKASATEQAKEDNEQIKSIERLITLMEKYRKAYDDLYPIFGENTAAEMTKIFGEGDYSPEALTEQMEMLLNVLRSLGGDGAVAAQNLMERLGLDDVSRIKAAHAAMQKWEKTLRKLQDDFGGDYKGIEHDIDKVRMSLVNANKDADEDYAQGLLEIAEAYKDDAEGAAKATEELKRLTAARKEANRVDAQEKLTDLATKYVTEKTHGMPLKDWGDKSIGQVKALWDELQALASSDIVISAELQSELDEAGLTIDDFVAFASGKFKELSDEAQEELKKKVVDAVKTAMSSIASIGGSLEELGEAIGDSSLKDAAKAIQDVADGISGIAEGFLSGGVIGAAISAVTWLANSIIKAFTAAEQYAAAIRAANEEARKSKMLGMLGEDSIFGENGLKKMRDAAKVIKQVKSSMASRNVNKELKFGGSDRWMRLALYGKETIADLAKQLGRDLYDSYGNLNAETLQAILDTYEKLDGKEREWIEQAINDSEVYSEAMKQLDSVMESVFGSVASSAADKIVDDWANMGSAALDYADILDDVARSYAKMITESMLLDSVMTPEFKAALQERFAAGDTEGAMELILGGLQQIQAMAPQIADALEPLRPYIQNSSSGDSLKDGINKELVEGNSSLIASYMNAMRADLSVLRTLQSSGWQDVRIMREYAPTYADYMAQISANTFDSAQASQAILAKLQSVIGNSTNGGSAVRTMK